MLFFGEAYGIGIWNPKSERNLKTALEYSEQNGGTESCGLNAEGVGEKQYNKK